MGTVTLFIGDSARSLEQHAENLQPQPNRIVVMYPEHRLHPRTVKETIHNYWAFAEENNVDVFIYSLSDYAVDCFASEPECVFVIDCTNGTMEVKNLLHDIITPINAKFTAAGEECIPFTDSLGTHWVMGFFGCGVPNNN